MIAAIWLLILTGLAAPPAAAQLPPAPAGLTAVPGDTKVQLNWEAIVGATGYNVEYAPPNGVYTVVQVNPFQNAFEVTNLVDGTQYTFSVQAITAGGTGPWYAPPLPATPRPNAPSGLTAQAGDTAVTLAWSQQGTFSGFRVYRMLTTDAGWTRIADYPANNPQPNPPPPIQPAAHSR